eukprot:NODE_76_length_1724_cov_470.752035_g75_i0.p1 GENE.NODE_76_length_1724_cov_470.752035_g75_i0~~NODE_76_length_1724_cov_470.752035_g75_i0.p1  ORF type:complete len:430 (+),score=87.04 NODE_76_length_1724_cov_470.752035_g75_i0:96-1385(+)
MIKRGRKSGKLRERIPVIITVQVFCHLAGAPKVLVLEFDAMVTPEIILHTVWELYQDEQDAGRMYCSHFVRSPNVLDYTLQPALSGGRADTLSPPLRPLHPLRTQLSFPHALVFTELETTKLRTTSLLRRHEIEREELQDFEQICRTTMIEWYELWFDATSVGITEFLVAYTEWEQQILNELIEAQQITMTEEAIERSEFRMEELIEVEMLARFMYGQEWGLFSMIISKEQAVEWASLLDHADLLRDLRYIDECAEAFSERLPVIEENIYRMYLEKKMLFDLSLAALGISTVSTERITPPPTPPPLTYTLLVHTCLEGADPITEFEVKRGSKCTDICSSIWDSFEVNEAALDLWPSKFLRDYCIWYDDEPIQGHVVLLEILDEEPYEVSFSPGPLFVARQEKWRHRETYLSQLEETIKEREERPASCTF